MRGILIPGDTARYATVGAGDPPIDPPDPPGPDRATLAAPADGATLTGASQTFAFARRPGDLVGFWIGTNRDADDVFNSGTLVDADEITATGLPTNGREVHLRVASRRGGDPVLFTYYTFTAHTRAQPPDGVGNWPPAQSSITTPSDVKAGQGKPGFLDPWTESTGVTARRITRRSDFNQSIDVAARTRYSKPALGSRDGSYYDLGDRPVNAVTFAVNGQWGGNSASRFGFSPSNHFFGVQGSEFLRWNKDGSGRTVLNGNLGALGMGSNPRIGSGEGIPSLDDRFWLFDGNGRMGVYDVQEGELVAGTRDQVDRYNWASVSLSGRFVVEEKNRRDDQGNRRWWCYDLLNWGDRRLLDTTCEHSCLLLDEAGDDWIFQIGDRWSAIRLKDAFRIVFGSGISGQGHASGAAVDRRGYAAWNLNSGPVGMIRIAGTGPTRTRTISADGYSTTYQEQDATNEVEVWGLHRTAGYNNGNYYAQAQVAVNAAGTRLVTAGDWYGSSGIESYMLSVD